jgi:hypothetical protein
MFLNPAKAAMHTISTLALDMDINIVFRKADLSIRILYQ